MQETESQGEFKQRITSEKHGGAKYGGLDGAEIMWEVTMEALDEARKEFPYEEVTVRYPDGTEKVKKIVSSDADAWFKKWFGA
jgi:hypothetical protein